MASGLLPGHGTSSTDCGTMVCSACRSRAALAVALLAVLATTCTAAGVRGFPAIDHGMLGGVTPPVTVHNPADDVGVMSVFLGSGATDEAATTGFRDAAASIVSQLTVQAAAPGVTVLGGDFGANEVARAAFNDTIDECVAAWLRR